MSWILAQASKDRGFWMPPDASTVAGDVDGLFTFIAVITGFFFLLVMALMVYFVVKYRHRPGREDAEEAPAHSTALELTWTIVPAVLVLMIFYFGFRGFLHMAVAPPNAYEINVTASMWNWQFTYPNGYVDNELHIPVNMPVRLVLQSPDAIHSLFIPQFRLKRDAVPGRYNRMWFEATTLSPPEGFDIYCTEYCGTGHSSMRSRLIVHTQSDFTAWLEKASNWETRMTPVQAGETFVKTRGCLQCHTVDGSRLIGPSFKNLFGAEQAHTDGSRAVADENYIRESIYEPNVKIVAGYLPQMPSYRSLLKDRDVHAIVEYLKSLSDQHRSETINLGPASTSAPAGAATQPAITQ